MRLVKGAFTALPCKSIVLSMFLVALLVGVSGAGVSGTRVHVPTRSASPASLPGELMMPRGAGPFPAVIILHGCYGIGPPAALERLRQYASWYVDRGYAGLILDSFAPRGVSRCIGDQPTPLTRAFDAYRALEYLAALGSIDPGRVMLQGHSHGGATVLSALDQITVEMAGTPVRFAGGVAYYPPCAYEAGAYSSAEFYAPVLILIGEKDDWTPAADCEQLHARQHAQTPGRVRLTVFPGATHAFDFNVPPRRNEYGKYQAFEPRCRAASGAFPS